MPSFLHDTMAQEQGPINSAENSGSASRDSIQESPPRPFPHRTPEFSPIHPRGDRLGGLNDDDYFMRRRDSARNTNDAKSCFVVSITFFCFVAMTLAFGLYAPDMLRLRPDTSILIKPNRLLVDSVKVVELDIAKGSMLYGFYKPPPLDVVTTWDENHNITFPGNTHKEWMYYLNTGSQVNIYYSVDSPSASSVVLAISEGAQGLAQWLEDPSNPNATLSWNKVHGNGSFQKDISESSSYYVGVGNLKGEVVKVHLRIRVKAFLYNTTTPYYECAPAKGECIFRLFFSGANSAVLSTPGRMPGMVGGEWNVKLSYGPRWVAYLVGTGGIACLLQQINHFLNPFRHTEQPMQGNQHGDIESERNPLLVQKDDKLLGLGSSRDSISEDEEHPEDSHAGGKSVNDEEHTARHCAICFDAPKDSFFIPCGHCVACYGCAARIVETSGACPICRRRTKEVRKIYTV